LEFFFKTVFFYPKILTLNRICLSSNSSVFQVDRGVSEGLSAELARESTWWGKGKSIVQHELQ
jgi:hypothetical protein